MHESASPPRFLRRSDTLLQRANRPFRTADGLLARAVTLVAGMAIPEQMGAAVLARVVADLAGHTTRLQER